MAGKLQKMQIYSYSDVKFEKLEAMFEAQLNPENYTQKYQVKYVEEQVPGTSGKQLKFDKIEPQTMEFEYIIDHTGALENTESTERGVEANVDEFKALALGYDGNIHRTRYLKLVWGTLLFKCCIEKLDVTYKLFKPDGTPIRALIKAVFKEFKEDERRVAEENASSPDLTHVRMVNEGDTIHLLTHKIYGDPKYYMEIARINGLTNFRRLDAGQKLFFPPINKNTK
jgi:hypothetical protein